VERLRLVFAPPRLRRTHVLIVIANRIRHPFFIRFLQWEAWPSRNAEYDGEQNQAVEGSRDDEGQPHAEIIDLQGCEYV
jgi:hypothetical protein